MNKYFIPKHLRKINRKLIGNFSSLLLLQIINYTLPLITIPYLLRVIGIEKYGLIVFAGACTAFLSLLTDYGFNLTGTRDASVFKYCRKELNEVFSLVMTIKFFLMLFSFITLVLAILFFDEVYRERELFMISFGIVIGNFLFPLWLFHGIEKMKLILIINVISKSIFYTSIIYFVNAPSDYLLVPIFTSASFIMSGALSLFLVFFHLHISYNIPSTKDVVTYFRKSWGVFVVTITNSFYECLTPIFVGFIFDEATTAYFGLIDKLKNMIRGLFQPAVQAIFPRLSSNYKLHTKIFYRDVKTALFLLIGVSFMLISLLYSIRSFFIHFVFGDQNELFEQSFTVILTIIPTLPITSLLGLVLVIQGREKLLYKVMGLIGVVSLLLLYVLSGELNIVGIVSIVVLVQYMVASFVLFIVFTSGSGIRCHEKHF